MKVITIFFLVICANSPALCLDAKFMSPAIDYFRKDNIKSICLITCEDKTWTQKFVKSSANFSIKVSAINEYDVEMSNTMRCLRQKYETIGVVIQANCPFFEETMVLASNYQNLDFRHKWIIYVDSYIISDKKTISTDKKTFQNGNITDCTNNITENENSLPVHVIGVIKTLNLSVDTDITIFQSKDFDLYEIFNYGKIQGGHTIIRKLDLCHKNFGCKIQATGYKYYDRWDFEGWSMRMHAVITIPPKVFDKELITGRKRGPGVAVITQTSASILHVVADMHNFSYKYSVAEKWIGTLNKNRSSKDILSGLYYGEHDITPVLRFLPLITDYVDFVLPSVTFIETRFYYRIPTTGPGKFQNQFLTPFSKGAWLCVVAVISMCGLVLLISAKFERRTLSVQYSIFTAIAALCQQTFEDSGKRLRNHSTAQKMTVFITGLSCVLVYNYYTSSVVSWLLNGPPPSINSLKELMESPLELILEDIGYSRSWVELPGNYYFNTRNTELEDALRLRKIYTKKKGSLLYASVEEGIAKLKTGGFAFHTEVENANSQIAKEFTQSELCELGSLQSMEKTLLYACLQKNSPYKEFFVWSLARLLERGIVSCIQRRTRAHDVRCEGSSPRALTLGGAAPAFMLLAAGYLLAVVIMLGERYIHKTNKKSRRAYQARPVKPRKYLV